VGRFQNTSSVAFIRVIRVIVVVARHSPARIASGATNARIASVARRSSVVEPGFDATTREVVGEARRDRRSTRRRAGR
jgi:hypothetical protein